jgi:hypothetical protein
MKITLINNHELLIQARNPKDFQDALIVAKKIGSHDNISFCSYCENEMWCHVTAGVFGDAEELNELYKQYKLELKGEKS